MNEALSTQGFSDMKLLSSMQPFISSQCVCNKAGLVRRVDSYTARGSSGETSGSGRTQAIHAIVPRFPSDVRT